MNFTKMKEKIYEHRDEILTGTIFVGVVVSLAGFAMQNETETKALEQELKVKVKNNFY